MYGAIVSLQGGRRPTKQSTYYKTLVIKHFLGYIKLTKEKTMNTNDKLINDYKKFLDNGKTERECVTQIIAMSLGRRRIARRIS